MQCQQCGVDIKQGKRLCASCDSAETPIGIKLYIAIAAPYWVFALLFAYGIQNNQPIISGIVSLFAVTHLLSLPGIHRRTQKHLSIATITYGLWLILGISSVLALPLFSSQSFLWFVPIPFFLGYLYRLPHRGGQSGHKSE